MISPYLSAAGNQEFDSFNKVKKILMSEIYYDHRISFYCAAIFDSQKNIDLPVGFTSLKHKKRMKKLEWEHVVPAENMGHV